MNGLYVIEVINKKDEVGYIVERAGGLSIASGMTGDMAMFKTYKKAEVYIRKLKSTLRQSGIAAYPRSMDDLIKSGKAKGMSKISKDVFYVENEDGQKLCYDPKKEGYFFDDVEAGFPCWETREIMEKFVEQAGFEMKVFIKTMSPKED